MDGALQVVSHFHRCVCVTANVDCIVQQKVTGYSNKMQHNLLHYRSCGDDNGLCVSAYAKRAGHKLTSFCKQEVERVWHYYK